MRSLVLDNVLCSQLGKLFQCLTCSFPHSYCKSIVDAVGLNIFWKEDSIGDWTSCILTFRSAVPLCYIYSVQFSEWMS